MKVSVEKKEKNTVKLQFEVDASKFEEGMEKAYRKNAKKFNVPGFRKGKAPRKIVERYYGEEVLYEDAFTYVYDEVYEKAIKENNIQPVDRPSIDIVQIGSGKDLIFTAEVTVKPEVELGQYKGIEVEKKEVVITDEDVENELKEIAERNSRFVTVEDRPVQEGDMVIINFKGYIDGEPFEGGEGNNYPLVIGSGQFIKGFEEQLIGVEKNKEVDVNVTFPDDYGNKEVAGKSAVFKVTVNEIKKKELPVIDDEFAQDVSEFDTLEEYKADLRKKLIEREEHRNRHELEDKLIETVVENAKIDIPEVMIDTRINEILYEFDLSLRYRGMDLEKYLKAINQSLDEFKKQFTERAEREVRTQLVFEKIMEVEGIDAEESEIEEEIKKYAENAKKDVEEFRKQLKEENIEYIKNSIRVRKVIDLLVKEAVMK
ncbi:MAG TPA: trigger factor [Clostridiaceae bacterium]|nr:trigger factor [Clostridiaceae bacterium]